LQSVIFAGDDRTDLDAVLEIKRLRQEGMAAQLHTIVETSYTRVMFVIHDGLR
jgi:hypothetical protein